MGSSRMVRAVLVSLALGSAGAQAGCGGFAQSLGVQAVAIMPGVMNRLDNRSLRFAMLKYGLSEFCEQMITRGAPLKLVDDQPSIGRFFPSRCETHALEDDATKAIVLQFSGTGYAWTNVTSRVGFEAAGVLEYTPDFLLADDNTMYLYFQTKRIQSTNFNVLMLESPVANLPLVASPGGFADQFGRQIVATELGRGFTVLRKSSGEVDFALGLLEKGKRPFHPYEVHGPGKVVLANERIEVHSEQREFLGPFEVDSNGRALYLTMAVDGVEAVDVLLYPSDPGALWLSTYVRQPRVTPPSYPPLMQEVVPAGPSWTKVLPVAKGRYFLVVDHTTTAGRVAPPSPALGDRAALLNYVVQLGDAP